MLPLFAAGVRFGLDFLRDHVGQITLRSPARETISLDGDAEVFA